MKKAPNSFSRLICKFGDYIRSPHVRSLAGKKKSDFSRVCKFPWHDAILYMIFRNEKCTSSEISRYFNTIAKPDNIISRQGLFKAAKKLNCEVFSDLIHKFSELFYSSDMVKNYKDYIILAEDGTTINLYATDESLDQFGFIKNRHCKTKDQAVKATSRSSALYDVTNGIIVDFCMKSYTTPEMPMAIDHIINTMELFKGKKVIYLADRNYDSVEMFAHLEDAGYNYIIRGKPNFFKDQIKLMKSNDEWITVKLDKAWMRRLKYARSREIFAKNPEIKIRVVDYSYSYFDSKGNEVKTEIRYFTNLSQEEFSDHDIFNIYSKRWDIETSYKTLKTDLEWERYFSKNNDIEKCSIYAKVIFYNMVGVLRREVDHILLTRSRAKNNKYIYQVNVKQLANDLRNGGLCRWIRSKNRKALERMIERTIAIVDKIKVPLRPKRHYKRWGRHVSSSRPFRYRLDGRQWPNTVYINGYHQTKKP